jgi:hypothetical protein
MVWPGLEPQRGLENLLEDRVAKKLTVVHFKLVAPPRGMPADENEEVFFSSRCSRTN